MRVYLATEAKNAYASWCSFLLRARLLFLALFERGLAAKNDKKGRNPCAHICLRAGSAARAFQAQGLAVKVLPSLPSRAPARNFTWKRSRPVGRPVLSALATRRRQPFNGFDKITPPVCGAKPQPKMEPISVSDGRVITPSATQFRFPPRVEQALFNGIHTGLSRPREVFNEG